MAAPTLPVTGIPEADELLVTDPLALLLGMLLDQQVPMEWAFKGPCTLKERLGGAPRRRGDRGHGPRGPRRGLLHQAGAAPLPGRRWPAAPTSCASFLVERYDGDAGKVWKGVRRGDELLPPDPGAARLRRREGQDLRRHPRQAARRGGPPAGRRRRRRSPTPPPARWPTSTPPRAWPGCASSRRPRRRRARARPTLPSPPASWLGGHRRGTARPAASPAQPRRATPPPGRLTRREPARRR